MQHAGGTPALPVANRWTAPDGRDIGCQRHELRRSGIKPNFSGIEISRPFRALGQNVRPTFFRRREAKHDSTLASQRCCFCRTLSQKCCGLIYLAVDRPIRCSVEKHKSRIKGLTFSCDSIQCTRTFLPGGIACVVLGHNPC